MCKGELCQMCCKPHENMYMLAAGLPAVNGAVFEADVGLRHHILRHQH